MKEFLIKTMAKKEVITCDICGNEMVSTQYDLQIKRTYKSRRPSDVIFWYDAKDWYTIDVCQSCAKEMIKYIKERRIK